MSEQYTREILKYSIAALCKHSKFTAIEDSVLEFLCDLIIEYIHEYGNCCRLLANNANHNSISLAEVLGAKKAMMKFDACSLNALRDYAADPSCYVSLNIQVPKYPIENNLDRIREPPSQIQRQPNRPEFLPPFPPLHSYIVSKLNLKQEQQSNTNTNQSNTMKPTQQMDQIYLDKFYSAESAYKLANANTYKRNCNDEYFESAKRNNEQSSV